MSSPATPRRGVGWQGQECRELANLALEIYGFMGWPASKKKRERQAQIEAIRARGK